MSTTYTRIVVLLAALSMVGCPGSLDEPERFREGGTSGTGGGTGGGSACPSGFDVVADLFQNTATCASKLCHGLPDGGPPPGGLDLVSPGLESRIVDQSSYATDAPPLGCMGSGEKLVDTANIDNSLILKKLTDPPCGDRMPISPTPLPDEQIACVRDWLQQFAASGSGGSSGASGAAGSSGSAGGTN